VEREPLGHDNKEGTSTAMEEEGGKAAAVGRVCFWPAMELERITK